MKIQLERFLALTIMIAAASCSSSSNTSGETGYGPDSSAATGGAAGAGGTAASKDAAAGSDGTAGDGSAGVGAWPDGALPDAGSDALADSGACLGDAPVSDAGLDGICDKLPTAATDCSDAGVQGGLAPDYQFCANTIAYLRPGVAGAFIACLSAVPPGKECSTDLLNTCTRSVFASACPRTYDGGASPCATISAQCPAVTVAACQTVLNAYGSASQTNIPQCFTDRTADAGGGTGDCAKDFEFCYSVPY
jgi:hypothetical protein